MTFWEKTGKKQYHLCYFIYDSLIYDIVFFYRGRKVEKNVLGSKHTLSSHYRKIIFFTFGKYTHRKTIFS